MKKSLLSTFTFCLMILSQAYAFVSTEIQNMGVGVVDCPEASLRCIYMPSYSFDHAINAGEQIVLNDGSIWSIGWWWQNIASRWDKDDIIKLSYHSDSSYNFIKIENVSRNEEAWGNALVEPDALNPNCIWIANIEVKSLIVLNNGMTFKVKSSYWVNKFNWEPGDLITILISEDKSHPYALYNHTKNSILIKAKLQQYPIGIMTPMATTR